MPLGNGRRLLRGWLNRKGGLRLRRGLLRRENRLLWRWLDWLLRHRLRLRDRLLLAEKRGKEWFFLRLLRKLDWLLLRVWLLQGHCRLLQGRGRLVGRGGLLHWGGNCWLCSGCGCRLRRGCRLYPWRGSCGRLLRLRGGCRR